MQAEIDVVGFQPDLVAAKDGKHIIIRCEIVNHAETRAQRSGKYIHLGLGPEDAMRLLSHLQAVQRRFGFLVPTTQTIDVPPSKNRN